MSHRPAPPPHNMENNGRTRKYRAEEVPAAEPVIARQARRYAPLAVYGLGVLLFLDIVTRMAA